MFNLHDFIFNNLVRGYKNGSFTKEQVSIYSVNYMTKGLFTETDVEKLNEILSEEPAKDTADSVVSDETTEETTTEEDVVSVENSVIDEIAYHTDSDTDTPVSDSDVVSAEDSTSEITADETSDSTVGYAKKTTTDTNDGESVAGLPEVE